MQEIDQNGIKIYALPDCDSDEDEFYKEKVRAHTKKWNILFIGSRCSLSVLSADSAT